MEFTAIGTADVSLMFPPRTEVPETKHACLIECDEGDGYRSRRFGELTVHSDGTATFIQEGTPYLLPPKLIGGENGDK